MTILCIDDDPDDVAIFCEAIAEIAPAASCVVAFDGQSGIDILKNGLSPDYIFLDINMPGMSGIETCRLIREDCQLEKTPVILYSTSVDGIDQKVCAGPTSFLAKASSYRDLFQSLRTIIENDN